MDHWDREIARIRRLAAEAYARMTLGEAMDRLRAEPFVCACAGPPCCVDWYRQALALQRAAHIAVKLMDERRAQLPA
jgi:hypothetical protein